MDEAWQQRVRERAYAIWQREGNPDGAPKQFWLMAEEELLAEGQGPLSSPASNPPASTSETGADAPKGTKTRKRS
jgi:hypothetical protein